MQHKIVFFEQKMLVNSKKIVIFASPKSGTDYEFNDVLNNNSKALTEPDITRKK